MMYYTMEEAAQRLNRTVDGLLQLASMRREAQTPKEELAFGRPPKKGTDHPSALEISVHIKLWAVSDQHSGNKFFYQNRTALLRQHDAYRFFTSASSGQGIKITSVIDPISRHLLTNAEGGEIFYRRDLLVSADEVSRLRFEQIPDFTTLPENVGVGQGANEQVVGQAPPAQQTQNEKPLMGMKAIAEYIDLSVSSVRSYSRKYKSFPIFNIGGRKCAKPSELDGWFSKKRKK